jgi:OOP family OmpA-OmpF porin
MTRASAAALGVVLLGLALGLGGCGEKQSAASATGGNVAAPALAAMPATQAPRDAAPSDDLFAYAAGAQFVQIPAGNDYGDLNYGPINMIDESLVTDWTSEAAGKPAILVLELAERTAISRLAFDTAGMLRDEKSPRKITVEISDVSATEGYKTVLATELKSGINGQSFPVSAPGPSAPAVGRYVRLTISSNYGDDYYGLTGFHGYGEQLTHSATIADVSGTYEGASGWGKVRLKQEGSRVTGCYDYREGIIAGGVEGRLLKVEMTEKVDGGGTDRQLGLFYFSKDGKFTFGLTRQPGEDASRSLAAKYSANKVSNDIGDCPAIADWHGKAAKSQLSAELLNDGRARLDGVNFDFSAATIQPGSRSLLDQVARMLDENAAWQITLEGHTDDVGGAAFNKDLSERRAAAVRAYLVSAGIAPGRLSTVGFGLEQPVASNQTQSGRAQNRRVEIVRK